MKGKFTVTKGDGFDIPERLLTNEHRKDLAERARNVYHILRNYLDVPIGQVEIVGSFVTSKEEPEDIDILVHVDESTNRTEKWNVHQVMERQQHLWQRIDKNVDMLVLSPHIKNVTSEIRMGNFVLTGSTEYDDTVVIKGGPGSGYHDHPGLPDVWGGSRSRGAKKAPKKKPKVKAKVTPKPKAKVTPKPKAKGSSVSTVASNAKKIEPKLTKELQELAKEHDGEMANLEFRLKSEESLARKIKADALEMGFTEEQAAANITDAVRYTMVFEPENYVSSVKAVQQSMAAEGWIKYDHKWKKYFDPSNAYIGYNCVFWNPDTGVKFELQFHTPDTNRIRNVNHKLYEEFRTLGADDMKRVLLFDRMNKNFSGFKQPTGWETLEGVMR